ncbi:NAD-specific glutamate dehydrogenase [Tsuneonella dongtanensis]|uniref:NAD-specific glutamate dehydrogenase n=1 Tax=Tsuneonella dongtanensis TaxID=692370 RepID=A0A1B2A9R5_9SPHN|nr:NAD-glutamate dehydrogenase domain-containing protein [Tsuneonella dongtanensis]ANY18907.1 NAD-specific glutamate dehydrogenase [Tsuneonella dongtanensis]
MAAKKPVSTAEKSRRKAGTAIERALSVRMRDSLLPGDVTFEPRKLTEAAHFLADAASQREAGEAVIVIASASEERRFMRIALVNDDMPFLVDSVAATVAAHGLSIDRLLHPVVPVQRNAKGKLTGLPEGDGAAGEARESMIYIETPRTDARQRRDLERDLRTTLSDVRAAVADWSKMREAMLEDAARLTDGEGAALLRWLEGGMLTQLGHLTRWRDGSHSNVLGICRKSTKAILADPSYDRAFAWFNDPKAGGGRAPLIIKANRMSNVHRRVPLDLFIVPVIEDGSVAGLSIHAGVWTSASLATPPAQVPRLRTQLADLNARFGFDPHGHAGKALVHALTALPHDLVIGFSDADIERVATTMMSLVDRPRPRLALVEAPLSRHLFAFVWLPRDMLSTQVRMRIEDLLEEGAGAKALDWSLQVEGGNLAMLRYVLDYRESTGSPDAEAIEAAIQVLLRGWSEAVESELVATGEEASRAAALAARFADSFPTAYRTAYGPAEAAQDIRRLRRLSAHETEGVGLLPLRDARLYRLPGDADGRLRLKVYQLAGTLALSDAVPALENFGFRVLEEVPTPLSVGEDGIARSGTIHDFTLALGEGEEVERLLDRCTQIEEAIAEVLNGLAEDDPFNRLVVGTGLSAREADWLRAFYRYLRQAGMGFTIYTVVDALKRAPQVTLPLVALFAARHDPDFKGDREAEAAKHDEAIRRGLSKVAAINDDRLLRLYHAAIGAVLRTNAFAPAAREALAFKIDSALVPGLPKPVPWREVFVYSRRVEGIHLRAGPVARGGLRWSDRRDDFRTEILGLMKAQRVKNAVIVPTGAKGGFYPKQLPDPARDREAWAAEGRASYEVFIRTLLSITDNIVNDKVVHPDSVVIHDGEDPYFVVAADKGTATFSDIANGIAESRDFWLDDAFASGGSNGYDHKAMGITAKGAWVSVQRHFLEMGVDVQTDTTRVVGCGDMSGDVFGNGMLLSKAIKLVAAFDHRHIFLDPDPDAAASWKERKRMFGLARSSWEDYDKALISKGGGVFARSLKRIPLSKEVRKALDLEVSEIEPEALISAILKAPVDLIWFGGIGTYVKASHEATAQVGDPANDALRVDASELRAKVIGEGANLGITQAARIEFALGGGRINTDFIDNSAGVNCSDNEVNIKIALAAAKRAGKLSEAKRVKLLESMTDEVAHLVLENNRLQALALSIAKAGGAPAVAAQLHLIEGLEARGALDRRTEGLASGEALNRRAADGFGLTRPELAVLLSSTKLVLQDAIEESPLADDPALLDLLVSYFPSAMRKDYRRQIEGHQLRRAIVATQLANLIVNRMGLIHPFELSEEEGAGLADICSAFVAAEKLFGAGELWAEIENARIPEDARIYLFRHAAGALRSQMADLIRAGAGTTAPSTLIAALGKRVQDLSDATGDLLTTASRDQSGRLVAEFVAMGAPEKLATKVAHLYDLDGSIGLAQLSKDAEIDARALTAAFTDLGQRMGLDWAQSTSAMMNPSDVWERLLVAGLSRDFQQMRLEFLRRLSRRKGAKDDPSSAVANWSEEHAPAVRQFRAMIGRAQAHTPVAPAMLAQIASQARNLLAR